MRPLAPVASHAEAACARALRFLDSYLDGELTVETNHELLEHLERCAACAREAAAREALRAAVRRIAERGGLPDPELAVRIRATIARTRPRSPATPLLLAAALALAASIAVMRLPGGAMARGLDVAEAAQVHSTLASPWPEAAPAMAALQKDAGPLLGPLLPQVAERLPGWDVVAAHRCEQEGTKIFHVILRRHGATGPASLASLVVVPGREGRRGAMALRARAGFTLVSEPGERATAFVVTSGGAPEAMELGRRAFPALRPVTA